MWVKSVDLTYRAMSADPPTSEVLLRRRSADRRPGLALFAQSLRDKIAPRHRRAMRGIVQNENKRAALLRSCSSQMHRRAAGNNHWRTARASDEFSIRRFETSFSCQRVPGFGSGMLMRWRRHAWVESRFHVLHGVAAAGDDGKRPNFVDALATKWTPAFGFDGEQPHFAIGPNHCTARSLGRVRIGTRRVGVEMPEHLRFGDLTHGTGRDDPAPNIVDPRSLADRPANLGRGCIAKSEEGAETWLVRK